MTLTANHNLLHEAAMSLLGVCDGARERDGVGFGKGHATMMHNLLKVPVDMWTESDWADCYAAVRHHQRQVPNFEAIQPVVVSDGSVSRKGVKKANMRVSVEGSSVRFAFNYSKKLVAAVKTIPGARFDRNTLSWTAPVTSHAEITAVIGQTGTEAGPEVWNALREAKNAPAVPTTPEAAGWVKVVGDRIAMKTPYAAKDDTRAIMGTRWDPMEKVWTAPKEQAKAVVALAEKHNLTVDDSVKALKMDDFANITATDYGYIVIRAPYAAKDDIKFHLHAQWDKALNAWTVPVTEVEPVLDLAGRWMLTVAPEVFAHAS